MVQTKNDNFNIKNGTPVDLEEQLFEAGRSLLAAERDWDAETRAVGYARQEIASLDAELETLHQDIAAAGEKLRQAKQAELELCARLAEENRCVRESAALRRAAMEEKLQQAVAAYEEANRRRDESAAVAAKALEEYSEKRMAAALLASRYAERDRLLREDYESVSRQLTADVKEATSRLCAAQSDHAGAEAACRLVRDSLNIVMDALAETTAAGEKNQAALAALERYRDENIAALYERIQAESREAEEKLKNIEERVAEEHREVENARVEVGRSEQIYQAAVVRSSRAVGRLCELYEQESKEADDLGKRMEQVLMQTAAARENFARLTAEAGAKEREAAQAVAEEADLREKVVLLREEAGKLRNSALAAANLAVEASGSRMRADNSMLPVLSQMEEAMQKAAEEAKEAAAAKHAELEAAEVMAGDAAVYAVGRREAAREARRGMEAAERSCMAMEQELFAVSILVEQRTQGKNSAASAIATAKKEYLETLEEADCLRESAHLVSQKLYDLRCKLEKSERERLETERECRCKISACELEYFKEEEANRRQLAAAHAAVSETADKQEKLKAVWLEKLGLVQETQRVLDEKKQTLACAQHEADRIRTEVDAILAKRKAELNACRSANDNMLYQAEQASGLAAKAYDDALACSVRDADAAVTAQEQLASLEQAERRLQSEICAELGQMESDSISQQKEAAALVRGCRTGLDLLTAQLRQVEAEWLRAVAVLNERENALSRCGDRMDRHRAELLRMQLDYAETTAAQGAPGTEEAAVCRQAEEEAVIRAEEVRSAEAEKRIQAESQSASANLSYVRVGSAGSKKMPRGFRRK